MGVRLSIHWNIGRGYSDRYDSVDLSEQFPGEEVGGVEKLKVIATEPGDKEIEWG